MNQRALSWLALVAAAALTACGGEDSDGDHATTPPNTTSTPASPTVEGASAPSASASSPPPSASTPASGALPFATETTYIGFWHGAAQAPSAEYNLGALVVSADAPSTTEGPFTARMHQTKSVATQCGGIALGGGQISGNVTATGLDGVWKDGTFNGNFEALQNTLRIGVQDNAGDHAITLGPCGTYFMPQVSQWTLATAGTQVPASFTISIQNNTLSWSALPDGKAPADWVMVSIFDEDDKILRTISPQALGAPPAGTSPNDQMLVGGQVRSAPLATLKLVSGHRYILAVSAPYQPLGTTQGAYASMRYTAP